MWKYEDRRGRTGPILSISTSCIYENMHKNKNYWNLGQNLEMLCNCTYITFLQIICLLKEAAHLIWIFWRVETFWNIILEILSLLVWRWTKLDSTQYNLTLDLDGACFCTVSWHCPFKTVPVSVYYVQYSAQLSVEILLSARQQRLQQKGMFTPFIKKKNR